MGNDEEYDRLRSTIVAYGNQLKIDAERFYQYAALHFDKDDPASWAKGEVNWRQYLDICHVLGTDAMTKPTGGSVAGNFALHSETISDTIETDMRQMAAEMRTWAAPRALKLRDFCDRLDQYADAQCAFRHAVQRVGQSVPSEPGLVELCAKIATGLRQVTADMLKTPGGAAIVEGGPPFQVEMSSRQYFQFVDRINGYAAELEAGPVPFADETIKGVASATGASFEDMAANYRRAAGMTEHTPFIAIDLAAKVSSALRQIIAIMDSHTRIGMSEHLRKLHIGLWRDRLCGCAAELDTGRMVGESLRSKPHRFQQFGEPYVGRFSGNRLDPATMDDGGETKPELDDNWFETAERCHPERAEDALPGRSNPNVQFLGLFEEYGLWTDHNTPQPVRDRVSRILADSAGGLVGMGRGQEP